jgi:hypothetical protein
VDISTLDFSGNSATTVMPEMDGAPEAAARPRSLSDTGERSPLVRAVIGLVEVKQAIGEFKHGTVGTLTAAQVFRDCSLRLRSSPPERRACRTLMRQAALKWRRGLPMGD